VEDGSGERAAVAVVRAWIEPGPPPRLKIRLVTAPNGTVPERAIGVTTDVEEACAFMRAWLISVASGEPTPDQREQDRPTATR